MSACAPASSSMASSSVLSASMHAAPDSPAAHVGQTAAAPTSPSPALHFPKLALDVTGHGGISLLEERRVEKEKKERRATMEADQERPVV